MRRRWEAFWVFFSTGYDDPKRESIEEDSTSTRAGRRRDDSYCGRPPPEGWRSSYVSPHPRQRPQSVLGFNIGAQVARATVPCLPAAGVLLADDLARVINPPTGGGLGGNNTAESRRPTTRPGSCGSGAPRPGWSRALLDIYLSHSERHQSDCSHYICSSRPLSGSAPAWVKASPRCPTHRLWGAVTLG